MGKRKSSKKAPAKKKVDPLPTVFNCLFCNNERSVNVKMDKKACIGTLECKVCGQRFQSTIHGLSSAVDVHGDWIDACEDAAKQAEAERLGLPPPPSTSALARSQAQAQQAQALAQTQLSQSQTQTQTQAARSKRSKPLDDDDDEHVNAYHGEGIVGDDDDDDDGGGGGGGGVDDDDDYY